MPRQTKVPPSCTAGPCPAKTKKAISRIETPLMASETEPLASDGAGYDDPENNNEYGKERQNGKAASHLVLHQCSPQCCKCKIIS